jgi:NAD(P)-dependent dehydrogenase (short-subunit alcohol dehydrogenase family)/acyl carrier protein
LLAQDSLDLVIANKNGPTQSVLSGRTVEIDRAAQSLQSRRVAHVRLPVAAAFHSPLVAGAAGPFRAALEPIPFHAAQLPVFANTTAREYPRDPQLIRDMLAQQIAKPVEFVEQIRNMVRAGVRTFVEVGPGRTLTRLVESILADEPHHVVALDASAGKRSGMIDLAHTLARLAALGHPVGLSAWDPDPPSESTVKSALTVPICGANYRKIRPQDQDRPPLAASPTKTQPPASPARPPVEPKIMAHQPSPDPSALQRALQVTQESLAAFQRLQEQTAQLHKQFLETQETAQQTLQTLVEGQHRIVAASLGMPVASSVVERPVTPAVERPRAEAAPAIERPRESRAAPAPLQPPPLEPKPQLTEPSSEHIQQVLIAIIAEKTGYPPEMLGLDMGLDADLGIDSIKRVEILSALQEKLPDAPVVKPEHLGTLHTLREIVAFLCAGNLPRATATETKPLAAASPLDRRVLRAVKLPACEPDSKALRPGAVYWIVADDSPLAAGLHGRLEHRGVEPQLFSWGASPPPPPAKLSGIVLLAPAERGDAAKAALRWLQVASPALRKSAGLLASVTQLDGQFGLSPTGPSGDPTLGALAGLTKTASHEWPEVTCKAIDLGQGATPEMLVDELCCAGPIEVGIAETGRTTLEATSSPFTPTEAMPFGPRDVIIVTGGARGVTAEVAVELARNGATLVLLGRSPEPQSEPADIAECRDDVALKRKLASRANATPRQIDAEVKTILAAREVGKTLERVSSAGGRAVYRTVDVRDRDAVQNTVTEVRRTAGPITAVIHGAGVLADRRIEGLTAEQFDSVYETKVRGLQNLLAATTDDPLAAIVLFSSSTGRFGRTGQAAYAAANEALNKLAQRESRRRPACRVLALNWGPWAGGMVTPPLARVFASECIGLIPLADGARHLVAELSASDRGVEVVVLGLGNEPQQDVQATAPVGVVFERELDLERAPVLRAHVIDGRAVLPLALTLEWLAHAAMHGHPGLAFQGCDQLRVFHPVLVREGEKTSLQVSAGKPVMRDGVHRVPVEIRGRRADGREVTHSRAEVLLHSAAAQGTARIPEMSLPPFALDPDDVYQRILFHGPELRGIEQIVGCGPAGIVVTAQSAPAPSMWLDQPLRGQWLADPLVLDCAFQAMSVWCHAQRGAVSLPSALGAYRQYRRFPSGTLSIACRVVRTQGQIVVAEIEFRDATDEIVARIDEFECVLDPSLNQAFRRNRLERAAV